MVSKGESQARIKQSQRPRLPTPRAGHPKVVVGIHGLWHPSVGEYLRMQEYCSSRAQNHPAKKNRPDLAIRPVALSGLKPQLETELQSDLDIPGPARSHDRVCGRHIGRRI